MIVLERRMKRMLERFVFVWVSSSMLSTLHANTGTTCSCKFLHFRPIQKFLYWTVSSLNFPFVFITPQVVLFFLLEKLRLLSSNTNLLSNGECYKSRRFLIYDIAQISTPLAAFSY